MLTALKQKSHACVDALKQESEELALYIGTHPELGYQEYEASKRLTEFLAKHGFSTELGVGGVAPAFVAEKTCGEGPVFALMAEYAALADLGHACGHNISGVASAAAAIAVANALGENLQGTIMVVGCPAEEGNVPDAGGKVILLEKGIFDGVHAAMSTHAGPRNILERSHYARAVLELNFYGKSAHSAASPEKGINALDATVLTLNAINALRQHAGENVRLHGYISKGGSLINAVPDRSQLRFGVRTKDTSQLDTLVERVLNCARGAALATGCRFEYNHPSYTYLDVKVNDLLREATRTNMDAMNLEYIPFSDTSAGSTDVGNVSQDIPLIYPVIAIGDEKLIVHSREFETMCCSQKGLESIHPAAKLMASTCLDILVNPDLRERFMNNKGL